MKHYWTNFHTHCNLCDGRAPLSEFVEQAIAKGLYAYGVSSHAPLPFSTRWNMKESNIPEYVHQFNTLKEKYKKEIHLYLGMEVDYIKDVMDIHAPWITNTPLDYKIGSIHYMGQLDDGNYWTADGSWDEFEHGVKQQFGGNNKQAVLHFFKQTKDMLQLGGIDILGHFDKIAVQNELHTCFSSNEKWYINEIKEVLQLCKEKNTLVEINTKSIDRKGIFFPALTHWKQMVELKNAITINADSHEPALVDLGFKKAYTLAYENGIREVALLTPTGWQMKPIDREGIRLL